MIMSLIDLLRVEPHPDEHAVRKWLEGNICRCTGYQSIVDAALECAQQQSGGASAHV
jgi:carbon-monoxide dehydrogenase small subunit